MKIFLVDDNKPFRDTLRVFIEGHLYYKVVGETENGNEFLDNLPLEADIILMDINMPGLNGIETSKQANWTGHFFKIIAISQYIDLVDLRTLFSAGIKGFVSKTNIFRDLDDALHKVYAGKYFFPDEILIEENH